MGILIWVFLVFLVFLLVRAIIAGLWNDELCNIALETPLLEQWYCDWDIGDAILNPKHYLRWTSKQWYTYLKGKEE